MVVFVIPRGRHQNIVVIVVDSIVVGAFVNDVVGVGQRDSRKAGIQYRQDDAEYRKRRGLGLPLAVFCALATSVISFVIITNLGFKKNNIGKKKVFSNSRAERFPGTIEKSLQNNHSPGILQTRQNTPTSDWQT